MERCYLIAFTLPAHVLILQAPAHPHLPNLTSNNLSFPSLHNAFLPISYQRTRKQKNIIFPFFSPLPSNFSYPLFPYIPFFVICIHTHTDLFVLFSFTLANWIIIFKELFFLFFSIHHHQAHLHHIFNLYTPLLHLAYPARTPISTITHTPFFLIILLYL